MNRLWQASASIIFTCVCLLVLPVRANAQEEWYRVQSGDTIETIAEQFGVSAESIIQHNGLARADVIVSGQILRIPLPASTRSTDQPDQPETFAGTHIVRAGESLQEIGELYGVDWQTLAAVNNLSNPNLIYVGQALVVPSTNSIPAARVISATPQPTTEPSRTIQSSTRRRQYPIYIVQYGDSFDRIARQFAVTVDNIFSLNGFVVETRLYIGDVILMPAFSVTVAQDLSQTTDGIRIQHVVQLGDTLATIADHYGRSIDDIAAANNLLNPNRITVGQLLVIP